MWKNALDEGPDGVYLELEVQPNSPRSGFRGYDEWRKRIKVSVMAEARDGKANTELISMLSEILGIPTVNIQITSGQTSGLKRVLLTGISIGVVTEIMGECLGPG
jgi:uncharacterized protein (TIGR00251 family)